MHAFYYGLPSDIGILVGKRNNLSSTKMYKMIEKANQEFEVRYESQQKSSLGKFPHYESGAPRNRQEGEWRDQRNDHSRQDSRFNNLTINPYLAIQTIGVVNRQ